MEQHYALWVLILTSLVATSVHGFNIGRKRAPLSVNQPLAVLRAMVSQHGEQANPLLALGKRSGPPRTNEEKEEEEEEKRAALSVNQPMSVLTDMYDQHNPERYNNPLMALGKREPGNDRASLLPALQTSNSAEAQQMKGDPENEVDKRVSLSVNQALHVLSEAYGEGPHGGEGHPLMALGKRSYGYLRQILEFLHNRRQAAAAAARKRAPLSVNQPLSVLSEMYGEGQGESRNPLLSLGKRTAETADAPNNMAAEKRATLSINQPLHVLSNMLREKENERTRLLALGKRPSLPAQQPEKQDMGVPERRFYNSKRLPFILFRKRAPLSVNSAITVLADMMRHGDEQGDNPLMALGK